jgi:hypothetical protein
MLPICRPNFSEVARNISFVEQACSVRWGKKLKGRMSLGELITGVSSCRSSQVNLENYVLMRRDSYYSSMLPCRGVETTTG